ncbi:MAG: YbgC/FadM family acyl-CoA thioesterase [Campylobacterota bacterium]|nr:YbgC/FadM family acyl-CoA thioesterase [Campylobacterota bacterium]
MQIKIYYEDTDAGGIVYHANYLNYCERARSEFFFRKGKLPIINDSHFVVRKMDCDFVASAKFADNITVSTKCIEIKKASFSVYHEIKRENTLLFKATVLLVLVNNGKVKRIDEEVKNTLENLFNENENN